MGWAVAIVLSPQAPEVLHVDERLISGEGGGITKEAGQQVIGGSTNASHTDAYIRVETVRVHTTNAASSAKTQHSL